MSKLKQILVIDDDAAMCALLRDFLTKKGYLVATVPSVHAALYWLQSRPLEQPVDLVLSDVKLGTASGIELAKKLSLEDATLPIILFSVFEEHAPEALANGARHFLTKPFSLSRLVQVLHEELGPL